MSAGFGRRRTTEAIIVHHTVTSTGGDYIAIWRRISADHLAQGYGGIAYHIGINPDGTAFQLADYDSWRAHIEGQNDRYFGLALLGDFTDLIPTADQLEAARRSLLKLREKYGPIPVLGHKEAALLTSPTACPGATWEVWKPLLDML